MSGENDGASEKTHEATPRRLERAREEGDLPRSQDAQTFAAYIGFTTAMGLAGGWAASWLGTALLPFLDRPQELAQQFTSAGADEATMALLGRIAQPVLMLVAAPAAVILVLLIAQRGIVFAPSRIMPKLSRLSPVENAKNKYGVRGMVEFAKSAVKLGALGVVLSITVWGEADRLALYAGTDARFTGHVLAHQFRLVMTGVLLVAGALALFDLIWQRFDHQKRMRMTHQELKDEGKQAEGDPQMRAQRRERGRQIANNRMLLAVPEADVVIANPTQSERMGQQLYASACAECHAADGTGLNWTGRFLRPGPPDFTTWRFVDNFDAGRFARRTLDPEPGTTMPSFRGVLSARQAGAIADYVRRVFILSPGQE